MNKFLEILEFLYYSIIFYLIVLFLTILINIGVNKIFPPENHDFVIIEIYIIWISLSVMIFYSKKFINLIPNPFTDSKLKEDNYKILMIVILIPLIVAHSSKAIKTRSQYLYDSVEKYFN
jgi:hypothetical protein